MKSCLFAGITSAFVSFVEKRIIANPYSTTSARHLFLDHYLVSDRLKSSLGRETNDNHWELSRDYRGYTKVSQPNCTSNARVRMVVCSRTLSCKRQTPAVSSPRRWF